MLTAYTTALPPSALPAAESTVAVVGAHVVFGVLLAVVAVLVGAVLQRALVDSRKRPALRLVSTTAGGAASRHAV